MHLFQKKLNRNQIKYLLLLIVFLPFLSFAQSSNTIDSLQKIVNYGYEPDKIDALNALAQLFSDSAYVTSIELAQQALNLSEQLDDEERIAISSDRLAYAYSMGSMDAKALEFDNKVLAIREMQKDTTAILRLLNRIGVDYKELGDYETAIEYFIKAAKIHETRNDSINMAMCYHGIATVFNETDNFAKALEYHKKSYDLVKALKHQYGIGIVALSMGTVNSNLKHFDEAALYFQEAIEIATSINILPVLAAALGNYSEVLAAQGKYTDAITNLEKASKIIKQIKFNDKLATLELTYGKIYREMGNTPKALEHFNNTVELAHKYNNVGERKEAYMALDNIYLELKNYKQAYQNRSLYHQLCDSLFNIESKTKIANIQIKYETEKKEKENLALKAETEINHLLLSQKNFVIYALIGGIVVVFLLLSLIYWQYRKKENAYQTLVKQNIELAKLGFEKKSYPSKPVIEQSVTNETEYNTEQDEPEETNSALLNKLENYFIEEKPFLLAKLSLDDLAKKLCTNRTYLSKAINDGLHKNFNDLLNEYRLKEARLLLMDKHYDHISIDGIGQMVGFATRSSFYNNFNKNFGISPNYFRQSIKK